MRGLGQHLTHFLYLLGAECCVGYHADLDAMVLAGSGRLPQLTAELAGRAAAETMVFVTWTNATTLDFALNWVDHLEEWGMPNFLLGRRLKLWAVAQLVTWFRMSPSQDDHAAGALDMASSCRLHALEIPGFEMFSDPKNFDWLPTGAHPELCWVVTSSKAQSCGACSAI